MRVTFHVLWPPEYPSPEMRLYRAVNREVNPEDMILEVGREVLRSENVPTPYEGFDVESEWAFKYALLRKGASLQGATFSESLVDIDLGLAHGDGPEVTFPGRLVGRSWQSFGEIESLVEAGFLQGDPRQYLIHYRGGSGGGGAFLDFAAWLLDHGVDLGLGAMAQTYFVHFARPVLVHYRNSIFDREARRIAVGWAHRGLAHPSILRLFVERRSTWDLQDLSRRLTIHPVTGKQLLRSLGYEPDASGRWSPGTRKKALRARQRWVNDEDKGSFGSDESTLGYPNEHETHREDR